MIRRILMKIMKGVIILMLYYGCLIFVEQRMKKRDSAKTDEDLVDNATTIENLLRNEGMTEENDDEVGGRTVLIGELDVRNGWRN